MNIARTAVPLEDLTLNITQEVRVRASLDATFAAILEEMGPANAHPDGTPMPMKLEPWPGGRWFRDLGDGNGHLWGHVQAMKRPTLIEICGPLFMSYAAVSNVQYRLTEFEGGTLIAFHHYAFGIISDDHRKGVRTGWGSLLARIQSHAEQLRTGKAAIQ